MACICEFGVLSHGDPFGIGGRWQGEGEAQVSNKWRAGWGGEASCMMSTERFGPLLRTCVHSTEHFIRFCVLQEGIVAVLTSSPTDVLSHIAIRARAQGVLLATCFDAAGEAGRGPAYKKDGPCGCFWPAWAGVWAKAEPCGLRRHPFAAHLLAVHAAPALSACPTPHLTASPSLQST